MIKAIAVSVLAVMLIASAGAAETIKVVIVKQGAHPKFEPPTVNAKPGDTIEWENRDDQDHTITADKGEFPEKNPITPRAPNNMYRITIAAQQAPGTVAYHCEFHPMEGKIVVAAP